MELLDKIDLINSLMLARFIEKMIPVFVLMKITKMYNLRCAYCYGTYSNRKM